MLYSHSRKNDDQSLHSLARIHVSTILDLVAIFIIALLINRFLRVMTNLMIKPAATQSRAAQVREQQTRTLASVLYGSASKVVWFVALLTAPWTKSVSIPSRP